MNSLRVKICTERGVGRTYRQEPLLLRVHHTVYISGLPFPFYKADSLDPGKKVQKTKNGRSGLGE